MENYEPEHNSLREIYDLIMPAGEKNLNLFNENLNTAFRELINSITISNAAREDYKIRLLVEEGVDVNQNGFKSPLMILASKQPNDIIFKLMKFLIQYGADYDATISLRRTVLMYSIINRNVKLTKYLINEGADLNIQDYRGQTALMLLLQKFEKSDLEILNLLISKTNVNLQNKKGQTALMLLFTHVQMNQRKSKFIDKNDYLTIIKLFIENNADLNIADEKGYTLLTYAINDIYRCGINTCKYLVKQGSDINLQTKTGETILMQLAALSQITNKYKYYKLFKYMNRCGANVNIQNNLKESVLIMLVKWFDLTNSNVLNYLINNANTMLNLCDINEFTALMYCCKAFALNGLPNPNFKKTELLIMRGAKICADEVKLIGEDQVHESFESFINLSTNPDELINKYKSTILNNLCEKIGI